MENIKFNPCDWDSMKELMDEYGTNNTSFFGENEGGEMCRISIGTDNIVVETYQHNDRTRINTYYRDGTQEELYED